MSYKVPFLNFKKLSISAKLQGTLFTGKTLISDYKSLEINKAE